MIPILVFLAATLVITVLAIVGAIREDGRWRAAHYSTCRTCQQAALIDLTKADVEREPIG